MLCVLREVVGQVRAGVDGNKIIINNMEFTEFIELQSLDFEPEQPLAIEPTALPAKPSEFIAILEEISELNHSRSLSYSLMQSQAQANIPVFECSQDEPRDQDKAAEIEYTPSVVAQRSFRKSNMFASTRPNDISISGSSVAKSTGIKVYYFGTSVHKFIEYNSATNIEGLIAKALAAYTSDLSLEQIYVASNDSKKYEMRFPKEEGSFLPDMSIEPLLRDRVITDSLFEVLVLVAVKDAKSTVTADKKMHNKSSSLYGDDLTSLGHVKLNIFNEANMHVSSLILSKDDTLQKAIDFLQAEFGQKITLTEGLEQQYSLPEDIDVRNLSTCKLYAKKRRYFDDPLNEPSPLKIISTLPKDLTQVALPPIGIVEASRYEEFQVIKINSRGMEQERILGIDQSKLYNYDIDVRKKNKETSFFSIFAGKNINTGTKKPERLISDINAVNCLEGLNFEVVFPEKKIEFVCYSSLAKQKILRKLKFLINYNNSDKKL